MTRNDAFFGNLIWEVNRHIRVGGEITYRKTGYVALPDNESLGVQAQFQWRF